MCSTLSGRRIGFVSGQALSNRAQKICSLLLFHCLGRYIYIAVTVQTDNGSNTLSNVTWFLTREEALAINPELSKVVLKEQVPLELPRTQINTNEFDS